MKQFFCHANDSNKRQNTQAKNRKKEEKSDLNWFSGIG